MSLGAGNYLNTFIVRMFWALPLALLIVFEAIADIISKEWSLHGGPLRSIAALSAYVFANIFWLIALKNGAGLTRGAIVFSVGSALVAVLIGLLLYKESLTKLEFAGVLLGLVAITLIAWPK